MKDDPLNLNSGLLDDEPPARKPSRRGAIKFQPPTDWRLEQLRDIEAGFQQNTGRALPVRNRGQGNIHNKWGYDHRNAADVSLNPNSKEGQALIAQLRATNTPFLAFDRAIPGVSTGPHIHIGKPSRRLGRGAANVSQQSASLDLTAGLVDEPPAPPIQPQFPVGTTRGVASGRAELVRQRQPRRQQQGQVESSGLGARPPSITDVRRIDNEAIQQADHSVRQQVRSERMSDAPAPQRLFAKGMRMFGPQGVPLLTAVREVANSEDALVEEEVAKRLGQQRLAETPEVVAGRQEFGAQSAPVRALTMPAGRAGAGLLKTLAGLSAFGGLAPNEASDYLNKRAAVLEQSASLAPLDAAGAEVERGIAEKAGGAVLDVGFTVAQLMAMKKATGLSLSKIMMLETALRTSDQPVKERAAQVAQAGVMGRALDVQMSRAGGAAVNVVPALTQEVPAVASGQRDPVEAGINVGVQAGVGALLTSPRRAPQLQPMPEIVTRTAAPPLRPSELAKRVALRGEVTNEAGNVREVSAPIEPTREVAQPALDQPPRLTGVGRRAPELSVTNEPPTQTIEPQPPVQARAESAESAAPIRTQVPEVDAVVAAEAPRSPDLVARPQWQHRDFGLVSESANQSGVGRGRVRVTAEDGSEHVIQRPKGNGIGNNIAIPVKDTAAPAAEGGQKQPLTTSTTRLEAATRQGGPTEPAAPPPAAVKPAQRPVQEAARPVEAASPASNRLGDRSDYDRIYPPGSAKRAAYEAGARRAMDEKLAGKKPSVTELPPIKPPPVQPTKAPEPSTTSARKAQLAGDRAELDLPTLPPAARKSWQESLAEAKPESANRLADEVLANPRGLNDAETASVVVRAQQVKNEHAAKMAQISAATDTDAIARLRGETAALEAEFDKLTTATKASGTEKGRALAAQKLTINQDFDLVSMVARAKAAKGRDLTPDERARYEFQSKRIAELETRLVEAQSKAQTAQLQKQIDRVKRQTKRGETRQVLDEEFAALKQQFATAKIETRSGVQGSGLAALDPEGKLTVLIAKMARNRVKAGVVEAEKLVDEVYGAIKDRVEGLRREDVRDSILAYGFAEGRERTWQTQLLKTEADVTRRLEQRDFSRVERTPPVYTRETYALQKRVDEIKAQFARELYRAEIGRWGMIRDTALSVTNIPKTGLTIGDLSAMGRQAGIGFYQHPILSARAAGDMFRSFTQHGFANVENAIKRHPDFQTLKRAGVEFTGVDKADPVLTNREEGYFGSEAIDLLARGRYNIPGKAVKAVKDLSERTFVSMLDSQRMRIGAHQLEALRGMKLSPKQLNDAIKSQAKYINIITGRGNLGRWGNQAAPILNIFGFSPRLVVSRFQFLNKMFNPGAWANMPKGARRLQMADNAKFLFGVASTLALIKAAGDQYPQLGISVNMDSEDDADFLKVKVGNARYDFLTGLQQPMRFLLRMTIHGGDQWGGAMRGGETYTGAGADTIFADFARSKAAPLVGYGWDALAGKNRLTGKKFEAGKDLAKTVIPLPFQDFQEAVKQDGAVRGIAEAFPSLFGVGVQTYPMSPERAVTHAEKLARRIIRDKMPETARTEEEMEKSRKASDLRARSRKGEDVTAEIPPLNLTDRQVKTITEAKGVPRFQEDFKRLGLEDALRVWSVASANERTMVKPLLADKADAVDQLDESKQAAVKAQLRAAGIVPIEELPAGKQREIVGKRRTESREQARARREKQRGRQRPSLGYGY